MAQPTALPLAPSQTSFRVEQVRWLHFKRTHAYHPMRAIRGVSNALRTDLAAVRRGDDGAFVGSDDSHSILGGSGSWSASTRGREAHATGAAGASSTGGGGAKLVAANFCARF